MKFKRPLKNYKLIKQFIKKDAGNRVKKKKIIIMKSGGVIFFYIYFIQRNKNRQFYEISKGIFAKKEREINKLTY